MRETGVTLETPLERTFQNCGYAMYGVRNVQSPEFLHKLGNASKSQIELSSR